MSGALFENVRDELSKHFMVITPDLPGFGKSALGTATGGDANYAREMLALLGHLGARTAVIGGHSMGGQITLEMYRLAPARTVGMILFDTDPAKASVVESHEFLAFPEQAKTVGIASIEQFVVPQMVTGATLAMNPAEGASLTAIIDEASLDGLRAGAFTLALRPDHMPVLPKIEVPSLVVVGINDQIYAPPISIMVAKAIPGSSLAVVRQRLTRRWSRGRHL